MRKSNLLVILGPTATGKSDLAVFVAQKFNGEIISADSRQVYKGMNLGTGKITAEETQGVRHHLLDVIDPQKQFSAAEYQNLATEAVINVRSKGKLPILCGGTGQYIRMITAAREVPNVPPDPELRQELSTWESADLFNELKRLDSRRASDIDGSNRRHLIRAIEIVRVLGAVPPLTEKKVPGTFFIGLQLPAEELRCRINERLTKRLGDGMLDEVRMLHERGLSWQRLESFGLEYTYCAKHLQGELNKAQMIMKLETEIWRYAKRQMTWFKKYAPETTWFLPNDRERIAALVSEWQAQQV